MENERDERRRAVEAPVASTAVDTSLPAPSPPEDVPTGAVSRDPLEKPKNRKRRGRRGDGGQAAAAPAAGGWSWTRARAVACAALRAAAKAGAKALVAALAVAAAAPRPVAAHGYLASPAARNVQHNSDWCPQCLNAGGPWTVYAKGHPARYGVCGDPWKGPRDHEAGGRHATPPRLAATYAAGQTFVARVRLTANHLGRWSLRLCPVPDGASPAAERAAVTQKCFDKHLLKRADGKGPYTPVPGGASDFAVKYRLPAGLRCRRCVVQWTYETGNSCNPPGIPNPQRGMESCATSTNGEAFWNCADVRIR